MSRRLAFAAIPSLFVLVCLEAVEATTHVFEPQAIRDKRRNAFEFIEPDSILGIRMKPNLRGFVLPWAPAHISQVYDTDELGFRNVGSDYRAVTTFLVGDSFTAGAWVDRDKSFAGLLEANDGPVCTLACGGYGFQQYEKLVTDLAANRVRDVLLPIARRRVILCVYANDISPLDSLTHVRLDWIRHRAALGSSLTRRLVTALRPSPTQAPRILLPNGLDLFECGAAARYTSYGPSIEASFSRILAAASPSLEIRVALLPSSVSAYKAQGGACFAAALAAEEEGYAQLAAIARACGVPCLDLTPGFREAAGGQRLYIPGDGHWDNDGHALAARLMGKAGF